MRVFSLIARTSDGVAVPLSTINRSPVNSTDGPHQHRELSEILLLPLNSTLGLSNLPQKPQPACVAHCTCTVVVFPILDCKLTSAAQASLPDQALDKSLLGM